METAKNNLFLGTSSVDITPSDPVYLAGFSHREGKSEGIANKLFARIWFFSDPEDPNSSFLLVQADLIWFGNEIVEKYKRKIAEKYHIKEASIIFHASHTHSGPQTSSRFSKLLGIYEGLYLENIMEKILESIGDAIKSIDEVNIYRSTGRCDIGVNRRKNINGIVDMAPNEEGVIDDELNVILFKNLMGATKGVMFHFSCHPTVTDSNYISSEYCGVASEIVSEWLGGNAAVSFLQGFCGDVRPKLVQNGSFYRGTQKDVQKFGALIAENVKSILQQPLPKIEFETLKIEHQSINLELEGTPNPEELNSTIPGEEAYISEWKRNLLAMEKIEPQVPLDVSFVKFSDELGLLFVNAEVVCEYGIFIKQISHKSVLPLGYSNGMIGYIPTGNQLNEGGYEPKTSIYYFGLPSSFKQKVESDLKNTFRKIIDEVG